MTLFGQTLSYDTLYLIYSAVLALIPAIIAKKKGRSFILWWFYGYMFLGVALIHSLLAKHK